MRTYPILNDLLAMPEDKRDSHIYTRIMVHLNDGAEWNDHYGKLISS